MDIALKPKWRKAFLELSISLILVTLLAAPAVSSELRLIIEGVRSGSGEILVGLYDNEAGFQDAIAHAAKRGLIPDNRRLVGTAIRAMRGTQSTVFTQLEPGRYALLVIHDENDNGRLDVTVFGLPTEGYGLSNNVRRKFAIPSFESAAITLGNANVSTSILLNYPTGVSGE